jgi:hypothetical protein
VSLDEFFELITAAALLLVILYWPTTNTGRLILIAAAVVWFVDLRFLFKWPSVLTTRRNRDSPSVSAILIFQQLTRELRS